MPYIGIPPSISSIPRVLYLDDQEYLELLLPQPLRRTSSSPDLTARDPHSWDDRVDWSTKQRDRLFSPNSVLGVHQQNDTSPEFFEVPSPQDSPLSEANGAPSQAPAAETRPRSRRSSICESVVVSWPKPGKVAILGYGNRELAQDVCDQLNGNSPAGGPRKLLCGHKVTAVLRRSTRPGEAKLSSRVAFQVAVFFGPLPETTDNELRRSIRTTLKPSPRQVTMEKYTATIEETKAAVESTLQAVAPLESFLMFDDSTKTRLEAVVPFKDLDDALKTFAEVNQEPLPPFPQGQLRVHLHDHNECSSVRCGKRS